MYNLCWGPNSINVFLYFENQCNIRSYSSPQTKIHGAFKIFFFHFHPTQGLLIFIHSMENIILFEIMHSLSSLSKDIVLFLQFENA